MSQKAADNAAPARHTNTTAGALGVLWAIVTTFTLAFYIIHWLAKRTGLESPIEVLMPDTRREHLPIFLLSIGAAVHAVSLWLLGSYARVCARTGAPSHARIPWPWPEAPGDDPVGITLRRCWLVVVLVFAVVGPLILDGAFWRDFLRADAWRTDTMVTVSLFEPVSPSLFFGHWDDHRYGDYAKANAPACRSRTPEPEEPCGVSYVPFWQPIILMLAPTLVAVALAGWVVGGVFRKPEKRRTIRR